MYIHTYIHGKNIITMSRASGVIICDTYTGNVTNTAHYRHTHVHIKCAYLVVACDLKHLCT